MAGIHHVEVWVAQLEAAAIEWGWLLDKLGFTLESSWGAHQDQAQKRCGAQQQTGGQSWAAGGAYITLTTSPNLSAPTLDRRQPGVNHLAFSADTVADVDAIMQAAPEHGWTPLYHDRYPYAGGADHYAGWLENSAGFKAEIVAASTSR